VLIEQIELFQSLIKFVSFPLLSMSKNGNPPSEWWLIKVVKNIMRCKFSAPSVVRR
jgi:hypothetical protein